MKFITSIAVLLSMSSWTSYSFLGPNPDLLHLKLCVPGCHASTNVPHDSDACQCWQSTDPLCNGVLYTQNEVAEVLNAFILRRNPWWMVIQGVESMLVIFEKIVLLNGLGIQHFCPLKS